MLDGKYPPDLVSSSSLSEPPPTTTNLHASFIFSPSTYWAPSMIWGFNSKKKKKKSKNDDKTIREK